MRIGKNIHTENKKKVYRKPVVDVVEMDREMRLVMMSPDGHAGDEDGPRISNFEKNTNSKPNYKEQHFNKSNNPFGGGRPDFER